MFDTIHLVVTGSCNMRCSYCYENGGRTNDKLTIDNARRIIDWFVDQGGKDIVFFGGEPMLEYDTIRHTIDYCELTYPDTKWNFRIVTNGTIIPKRSIEFFMGRRNLHLQVSIDGMREVHDENRRFASGHPSFDIVLNNFRKLKDADINRSYMHTLTREAIPKLYEAALYFSEYTKYVSWTPVMTDEFTKDDLREYVKQIEKIYELAITKGLKVRTFDLALSPPMDFPCGACKSMALVTPSGDLYPCHRFYFQPKPKYHLGNIFTGYSNHKDLSIYTWNDIITNLPFKGNCLVCIAANESGTGNYLKIPEAYDKLMQVEFAIVRKLAHDGRYQADSMRFRKMIDKRSRARP